MKQNLRRRDVLKKIFFSTLYLSAFTFGGGYVIVTLLQHKFVEELGWIDEEEMMDLVAIAQSAPGPIAVNGAIVVGYKLNGLWGVIMGVAGASLPPFILLAIISAFYSVFRDNMVIHALLTGMQAGVAAVIVSVVWDMGSAITKTKDWILILIMVLAFIANYVFEINAIILILLTMTIGVLRTLYRLRREAE